VSAVTAFGAGLKAANCPQHCLKLALRLAYNSLRPSQGAAEHAYQVVSGTHHP
jgi:hypothetical protein